MFKKMKSFNKDQNPLFIRTNGAVSRINKVIGGIKSGIPLLLEGETGTSKTATAKHAAEEIKQKVIVFNFSSQTSVEDLLGRVSKNSDSWSGFSFIKGPYTEAFENGYCIILDEINLAHETVLQCIEASLDSQTLSLDFSGSEVDRTIRMNPEFHLIATQNPLTNRFSQKRNFLSNKFTSRFQIINFGEIEPNELLEIAKGLSKGTKGITDDLIELIIKFHFEWQRNKFSFSPHSKADASGSNSSYFVFTIREISRTMKSIEKGLTPFESILINYGARYNNESKEEMKNLLKKIGISEEYKFFENCTYIQEIKDNYQIKGNQKSVKTSKKSYFYLTETLENVFSTSFHLLDSCQSILLVGPNGCGKTSIGRWIGDLYSTIIKKKLDIENYDYKFFICNPEMTIADVIGRYVPCKQDQATKDKLISDAQIEWIFGPVVDAMKNGDCLVLDQVDTAPSTILERLNSLFDGIGIKDSKFRIQENLENPEIIIDPKFRMIAISSLSGLNNLSPAFLNRFTIIHINEQLDSITEDNQMANWIRCISPYANKMGGSQYLKFIVQKIKEKNIKDKKLLTSSSLSKCVKGFFKLKDKFNESSEASTIFMNDQDAVLNFCIDTCILHISTIPKMSDHFIEVMLSYLGEDEVTNKQYDKFHFKEAASTKNIMAMLTACSIIGLHTILIGRTGIGKTAAAMAFSRINKLRERNTTPHIISFNGETQLDELYGYFTIEDGNFTNHQGELSQAMSEGQVFIADELNLADQQIIQSLNVAIEPFSGEDIILPVTGSSITVNEGFFFIGCQNDLTMNGRRPIPESIKKKVLCVNYPEPTIEDLTILCQSIARQFKLDNDIPIHIATLMMKINNDFAFKKWSLREVRILFRRIAYFQTKAIEVTGFTDVHHVALMLASSFKNQSEMINRIAYYVCSCFNKESIEKALLSDLLAEIQVVKLINGSEIDNEDLKMFDKDPENASDYSVKLKKGSLTLSISNSQLFFIPHEIQQLWQTIFEIYLTNQSEPLLLNGPSGFKTYLSGLISSLAPVIYLHSDSTVSSLIGQITLLDRHQAKITLLESLYYFTGYKSALKEPLKDIKMSLEETNEFNTESLLDCVNDIKNEVPNSFIPLIDNVTKHLIDIQNEERDSLDKDKVVSNNIFSNFISLFKPGLITRSIFSQNSLILKNFAQPAPTVIERFNELLSVTPILTLFEDTSNTFTTPENNKLYGFSNIFRIIGICHPFEKRNLSDAMLSRLTEIHVPEYSQNEQKIVFETYIENQTNKNNLLNILDIAFNTIKTAEIHISFRQKIKIIQVSNQWQKKFPEMNLLTIYIISILRFAGGPLPYELKQKLFEHMKKSFDPTNNNKEFPSNLSKVYQINENNEPYSDSYKHTSEHSCLALNEHDNTIFSSLSSFTSPNISLINNELNGKPNFRFTNSILDLIDIIFSFSLINYPLILEGPNGCGKSSAFFHVANCLGVKVVQISLSRSTTVEDLFGRLEPSTEADNIVFKYKSTAFLNAINNDQNHGEKVWILIEELHLASPSVIDALEPIFNTKSDYVTLPDGSIVQRGNFFIVGLLSKPLQKQSLSNTALYYKVRNYTKNEFAEICKFILERNHFNMSTKRICPLLAQLYDISSSSQIKVPVTPREAQKFVKMMNAASAHSNHENKLSDIEICQMIVLGRFVESDLKESVILNTNEALKDQGFDDYEEIPELINENDMRTTSSKKVSIKRSLKSKSKSLRNEINHLTKSEKQLFEFLALNVDEYTPIIVQGPTASGKTFFVQLFANIVGQNLKVLQLNSEISSSYIAGSYKPSKDLTPNDIKELLSALDLLSNFQFLLSPTLNKINRTKTNTWKPSDFLELKKLVENLLRSSINPSKDEEPDLDEEDIKNAREFINRVNSVLLLFNHLERNDSLIVKAMIEGDWLLLDGIESAPSDFLDRLSTLLDDPPILNLYERGSDYVYSTRPDKSEKFKLIHPNFRLFMTYNPINTFSNNVSPSFLSRCSLFSMEPIDSNLNDSAVIVSRIVEKSYFTFLNNAEISARIAKVHMKMKDDKQRQLTCRTLIHICREICYKNQSKSIDEKQLIEIIVNHYIQCNPNKTTITIHDKQKLINEVISIFKENVDDQLISYLNKIEIANFNVKSTLINILKDFYSRIKNAEYNNLLFNYDEFLSNFQSLQFKEYGDILDEFSHINKYIKEEMDNFTKEQISYLASFNTLYDLVIKAFDSFQSTPNSDEIQELFINSIEIQSIDKFSSSIFQIQLFTYLRDKNLYLDQIPGIFINNDFALNYLNVLQSNDKTEIKRLKKEAIFELLNLDLDSYHWNSEITLLQQICCSLFKFKECNNLFTGVLKVLFNCTFVIFGMNNFNLFADWLKWLDQFFKSFEGKIKSFSIPFNDFKDQLENWKTNEEENRNQGIIQNSMNLIEKIKIVPSDLNLQDATIISTKFPQIYEFIDKFYFDLKKIYLTFVNDKAAVERFYEIKKNISRLENDERYKIPLNYLTKYMDELSSHLYNEKVEFFNMIYDSIKKYPQQKDLSYIVWPSNQSLGQIEEKKSIFLDSLISYSVELEKLESLDLNSPQWTTMCQFSYPDLVIKEYIANQRISEKTRFYYKSIIRAQLLSIIYRSNLPNTYDFCNKSKIISFFNRLADRNEILDIEIFGIAQKLSNKYPDDTFISIPTFTPYDIVSLLVNPITKQPGFIFTETDIPDDLINNFYNLFAILDSNKDNQTFDFVIQQIIKITISYIQNKYVNEGSDDLENLYVSIKDNDDFKEISNVLKQILDAYFLCENLQSTEKNQLDFSDIQNINMNDFNSLLNKDPCIGFYIAQFPEVKNNINKIIEITSQLNTLNDKFPLILFGFRVFSHINCIQFQLPSDFPSNFAEELQELIFKQIKVYFDSSNGETKQFSNFIGFLLSSVPAFIKDNSYSDYLRNIIINLLTVPKEEMLKVEIMTVIKKILPELINLLGSSDWGKIVDQELVYKTPRKGNEVSNFLSNPWQYTLEEIDEVIKNDYKMKNLEVQTAVNSVLKMIKKISSKESISELINCVRKDELTIQNKIKDEKINIKRNDDDFDGNKLKKKWNIYSSNVKHYLSTIPNLPMKKAEKFKYNQDPSFDDFYDLFASYDHIPGLQKTYDIVIAILPSRNEFQLTYSVNKSRETIKATIENRVALFVLPQNVSVRSLNLKCNGADIKILRIPYDHIATANKSSTIKSVTQSFKNFVSKYENEEEEDEYDDDSGKETNTEIKTVKVIFGLHTLDHLVSKLNSLNNNISEYEREIFYDQSSLLELLQNDIIELEKFTPITYSIGNIEKPRQTVEFISDDISNLIISSKNNIVKSCFDLFSDEYIKRHDFFFGNKEEFCKMLNKSKQLKLKPKDDSSIVTDKNMNEIKASESLLTPSIFQHGDKLTVTVKEINVTAGPLLFGVDVTPISIRLCDFTRGRIKYSFKQLDKKLPSPILKRENGFLIIEIPVQSICSKSGKYVKNDFEKHEFVFEGTISLFLKDNPLSKTSIQYKITLQYIPLIAFVRIEDKHKFAIKNGKADIIPFYAGTNSKVTFKKLTNILIKKSSAFDTMFELNDNKANKPMLQSIPERSDKRICTITSSFESGQPGKSYLSMNFIFGLSKEIKIPIGFHISTTPPSSQLFVSIFSDFHKDFVDQNGIVNVGNLPRKVYFFIGFMNLTNKPIIPKNIQLSSDNYCIRTTFNPKENTEAIPPNKYEKIIYSFEASYIGDYPSANNKNCKGTLLVDVSDTKSSIEFTYTINVMKLMKNQIKYSNKTNTSFYIGKMFRECDVSNMPKDYYSLDNRIVVSPFCYSMFTNPKTAPRIKYSPRYGTFQDIFLNESKINQFEVLELSNNRISKHEVKNLKDIKLYYNRIYLFARFKNQPETFFPLFIPIQTKNPIFNSLELNKNSVEKEFCTFFYDMAFDMNNKYCYSTQVDSLFEYIRSHKFKTFNYAFIIYSLGIRKNKIPFTELLTTISNFTNYPDFADHFNSSLKMYGNDKNYQLISFISALNQVVYSRISFLRSMSFYLELPIPMNIIQEEQKKLFESHIIKISQIDKCKYCTNFKDIANEFNKYEKTQENKFYQNGYNTSDILKWTESRGLIESDKDEYSECLDEPIEFICKIDPVFNDIIDSYKIENKIEKINIPDKISIKSLSNMFDKVLSSTYILPFTIYTLKKNGSTSSLNDIRIQLTNLISIYTWQNDCSSCFPFPSFASIFKPAFASMIIRLKKSNLNISKFNYDQLGDLKDIADFVQIPTSIAPNQNPPIFTQPGNLITAPTQNITTKTTINESKKNDTENKKKEESKKTSEIKKKTKKDKYAFCGIKEVHQEVKAIPTIKKVVFKEIDENTKEIPDIDFLKYLVQEMASNETKSTDNIEYKPSQKSFHPYSLKTINYIGSPNKRIDFFLEASKKLSDALTTGVNKTIIMQQYDKDLMINKDTIYASILVDCSSTLSISQKAALATLAIALGNSLTAIRIPYSIILFCESNFQFILKDVDENHDTIHFEKLLDVITIRRKMSDMSSAICMAEQEIKPKDRTRQNHSIFVLTDGLTRKVKFYEQWKQKILNKPNLAIYFYFLDVLVNREDQNIVYPIWNKFRDNIKSTKSAFPVIYSKPVTIYNGDSIFVSPFIEVLSKFVCESDVDNSLIMPELAKPISSLPNKFLDNIIDEMTKGVIEERSFYAQCAFPKEIQEQFTEIEISMDQLFPLEPFTATFGGDINTEEVSQFFGKLTSFSHKFINTTAYQEIASLIFPLNKPSQYSPSENGSVFYFPGLIKFILTQGQDSKIFLEKKAGLIRSHSVFFVIDNSVSCFNESTFTHSFQTIFTMLHPLSKIDIPSLNIIITSDEGPVILCSERSTMMALDENSPLWVSLFTHLSRPCSVSSSFYSALMTAYQMKIQQKSASSVMFVLTDGCYGYNDRNEFNAIFQSLKAVNVTPITVGIGMNPSFINRLTDKAVYSQNSQLIWSAILYLFGKEARSFDSIKNTFSVSKFSQEEANQLENNWLSSEKVFTSLFTELNRIPRLAATFRNFYNEDKSKLSDRISTKEALGTGKGSNSIARYSQSQEFYEKVENAQGEQFDLGKKGFYKDVNLLIVLCWDATCSIHENHLISEEVLVKGTRKRDTNKKGTFKSDTDDSDSDSDDIDDDNPDADGNERGPSVVKALEFFGIRTKIVKNYIDASNELTKGIYSQVWIICGRMDGAMPGNSDMLKNGASRIDAFIDCVIKYWKSGGGVVFWTDNYPLTAEVNKFLEKATFKIQDDVTHHFIDHKVKFHIGGNYKGAKMMKRDMNFDSKTSEWCRFEGNTITTAEGYQKVLFNHELNKIFEGITIASAIKGIEAPFEWKEYKRMDLKTADREDIFPFLPFARSSDGGFSSLFYMSPIDVDDGNIVIDCGFSKLFFELTEEGVSRYVKNIAIWMLQLEKKDIKMGDKMDPKKVTPKPFKFDITKYPQNFNFRQFQEKKSVDLVFLIDATSSMRFFVDAVCDYCNKIALHCSKKFPGGKFRFGAVAYRDKIVYDNLIKIGVHKKNQDDLGLEPCLLDSDPKFILEFFKNLQTFGGGGDGPEDWVFGYKKLLHEMNWDENASKIVIHICDAPGHGRSYTCDERYSRLVYKNPFYRDKAIIYDQIQNEQDKQFTRLIQEAARKNLIFFCMNENPKAMFCFRKTKQVFLESGGTKFVIQNDYKKNGEESESTRSHKGLIKNLKKIAICAIDSAVAVSNTSNSDFESKCDYMFNQDFNNYNVILERKLNNPRSPYNH